MVRQDKQLLLKITVLVLVLIMAPSLAYAQYTSPSYKVEETYVGPGGQNDASSASYQARASVGDLVVGNAASSDYQIYGGFTTTSEEVLEVAVTGGVFDLGLLTESQAKAISTTFTVRNYLASGYTVTIGGAPPTNNSGGHSLAAMTSAGASSPGTEQFGINLVANSLPVIGAFGADPSQVPDVTFSYGVAATDYDTTNQFKYVPGDTIAQSTTSSGVTEYTLSAIANISTVTPGGDYGGSLFIIVIPTF